MKILIVAYFFPPDNNGGVQRPLAFYNHLKRLGHEVHVLTHGNSIQTEIKGDLIRVYDANRTSMLHLMMFVLISAFRKLLGLLGIYMPYYIVWKWRAKLFLANYLRQNNYDYVIASYPPVECLDILPQKMHSKLIADFRDPLYFESAEFKTINKFPYTKQLFYRLERSVAQSATLNLVISPAMAHALKDHVPDEKIMLLPNGFDIGDIEEAKTEIPALKYKNVFSANVLHLLYTGTLSYYDTDRNLNPLLHTINEMPAELQCKFKIHLYGDIKKQDFFVFSNLIELGVLIINNKVTRQESLFLQQLADVLVLVTGNKRKTIATGKIFEYIFAQKPILAFAHNNFASQIINETNTGKCFQDKNEIKDYLLSLLNQKCHGGIVHKPNITEVMKYDRKEQVKRLEQKMLSLMG